MEIRNGTQFATIPIKYNDYLLAFFSFNNNLR